MKRSSILVSMRDHSQCPLRAQPAIRILHTFVLIMPLLSASMTSAQVGAFTKAQVGERIRKVEDGVDEFRKWAERRGEEAEGRAHSAQNSGRTGRRGRTATESQKEHARQTKDDLEDALSDLNRSTNRLRRKFGPASNYAETRAQMDRVMDDGRRINQVMVRGNYGTQAERYWGTLRAAINDLARCYGLAPMGV